MDPEQLELWPVEVPTRKEKPLVYRGAPRLSLLSLQFPRVPTKEA